MDLLINCLGKPDDIGEMLADSMLAAESYDITVGSRTVLPFAGGEQVLPFAGGEQGLSISISAINLE